MQGTITGLRPDLGFGFLTDAHGVQRFFHRTAVVDDFNQLRMQDTVTFAPAEHPTKGPRATDVRKARA